jgi:cytochrome c-type biogenesis protein CcmE
MRIPHAKFVFAGALIIAGICYLMFSGISESMVYYYTVSELRGQSPNMISKGVRVSGHVRPGSIQVSDNGTRADFLVYEKSTDESIPVTYSGIIPDTFKDSAEVVVEGTYEVSSGTFVATTLLAKCPSKYEGKADEHPGDYPVDERAAAQ